MIDPKTHIEMCNAEFAAGAASRNAEVAELKAAYVKVTERIHMVGGYLDQIKLLRNVLTDVYVDWPSQDEVARRIVTALEATEKKQ